MIEKRKREQEKIEEEKEEKEAQLNYEKGALKWKDKSVISLEEEFLLELSEEREKARK